MSVAIRSNLVAAIAAFSVSALAAAPVVAPPHIQAPAVKSHTVELAASPANYFDLLVFSMETMYNGSQHSVETALILYSAHGSYTADVIGKSVLNVLANPSSLPAAIARIPGQIEAGAQIGEQQTTGVFATGITPDGDYTLPGEASRLTWIPLRGVPQEDWPASDTVDAGYHGAIALVAEANAALTGSETFKALVHAGDAILVSFFQAQGLVRSATLTAIQDTLNAAVDNDGFGDVPQAINTGLQNIGKSIVGDPSVPKVTPTEQNTDSYVGTVGVHTGTASDTAEPVKRQGAIRTFTSTVRTEAQKVADSLRPQSSLTGNTSSASAAQSEPKSQPKAEFTREPKAELTENTKAEPAQKAKFEPVRKAKFEPPRKASFAPTRKAKVESSTNVTKSETKKATSETTSED